MPGHRSSGQLLYGHSRYDRDSQCAIRACKGAILKRLLLLLGMLLLFSVPTFGQGIRFGDQQPVQSVQTPGGPIYSVPNATINFCNSPANGVPCTNKVTTYTDITLTTACPTSTQVVLSGTNSCVATTDQYGNWGVWISPGVYTFTIQVASGAAIGPYTVTISGGGGSILPTVNNWLALNNFTAGATIFGLPIAGFSGTFTIGDCPIVSSTNPLQFSDSGGSCSGGGGSGTVISSPQYHIFAQPTSGSAATAQGLSGIYSDSSGGNLYTTNLLSKGPNPRIDAQDYGARAVQTNPNTTCTTSGSSPYVTLNCASATGFQVGDGLAVLTGGSATSQSTPSAPTVTSPVISGSKSYSYECVGVDGNGGLTAASSAGTVTTAPTVFGNATVAVSGVTWSGGTVTVSFSSTFDANSASYVANTKHVSIVGMGTGLTSLNGYWLIASEPSTTSLTFALAGSGSGTSSAATGRAVNTFLITAMSRSGSTLAITTDISSGITVGAYPNPTQIIVTGMTPADLNGYYRLDSTLGDSVVGTVITINQTPISSTETASIEGQLSVYEYNLVSCPNIASPTVQYYIYGTSNPNGTETLMGKTLYGQSTWKDPGYWLRSNSGTFYDPPDVPTTPPGSASNQRFGTTITGISTNTLTVSPGLPSATTSAPSYHDDAEAVNAALSSIVSNGFGHTVVLSPAIVTVGGGSNCEFCQYHFWTPVTVNYGDTLSIGTSLASLSNYHRQHERSTICSRPICGWALLQSIQHQPVCSGEWSS